MSLKSKLKRRIGKNKEGIINTSIYKAYGENIDENIVYFESRDGNDFTGNIFRIVEELSTGKYGEYKIYVYAKAEAAKRIEGLRENYNLNIHKIITKESAATRILEKAKYIFTDSGIRPKFIKRPEQILLNTWHGTPLKVMGVRNVPEQHRIGSIQHTFLDADYLLYPNDFMCDVMLTGYMIDRIYPGKVLLEGYPRNSVFLDEKRRKGFKSRFGFQDKDIFVYMPTYRGTILERKDDAQKDIIDEYLTQLDAKLNDSQILFVKLHVFNQSKIDFSKFRHVMPFPQGYEIYDIINMADVLISDYSSVFFDFALSRRKIIIFNYDEEEYLLDREVYFPISDLPFPKVQTVDDLILELNSDKNYDDREFVERFCKYESIDAAEKICRQIFNGEDVCRHISVKNSNPNVLFYVGSLDDSEVLSNLLDCLSQIDSDKMNVFLSFRQWDENICKNHESIFRSLPEGVGVLPFRGRVNPTLSEKDDYDSRNFQKLGNLFERELKRYYHGIDFELAVNFDARDMDEMMLFMNFTSKKAILKRGSDANPELLDKIYSNYDEVFDSADELNEYIRGFVNEL